jgi:hypothetical protein
VAAATTIMTIMTINDVILEIAMSGDIEDLQNTLIRNINDGTLDGTGLLEFVFEHNTAAFYLLLKALVQLTNDDFINREQLDMMMDGVKDTSDSNVKLNLCNLTRVRGTPIILWIIESVHVSDFASGLIYTSFDLCGPEISVSDAKDMIDFLIRNGASLFIEDNYGDDAMEYVTNQDLYSHRNRRNDSNVDEICNYVTNLADDDELCRDMRREVEPTFHCHGLGYVS